MLNGMNRPNRVSTTGSSTSVITCVLVALAGASCSRDPSATTYVVTPPLGALMATSSDAAALIARAKRITTAPSPKMKATRWRKGMSLHKGLEAVTPRVVLTPSSAEVHTLGTTIHAYVAQKKPAQFDVVYPTKVQRSRTLRLSSGGALSLALHDASEACAEYANGYVVYRGGTHGGADVIVRPSDDGFEDYFFFDKRPAHSHVDYDLTLSPAVAGLRLTSNILELVGANGVPLIHVSPPFLVDSAGKRTAAQISVAGCALDTSTQPTWKRKPTPPGADRCSVIVSWNDDDVRYPALIDPNWTTATTMAVPRFDFSAVVLAKQSPQYAVAIGGFDASFNTIAAVEFFDPDSGTWSPGPSLNVARYETAAVAFNLTGAAGQDQVFVSGGYSDDSQSRDQAEDRTEILAKDGMGNLVWSQSATMASPRDGHTATLIGSRVLLTGGRAVAEGGPELTSCEIFDLSTQTFVSPAPPEMHVARWGAGAALLADGHHVIVAGGMGSDFSNLSSAELYDGNQWLQLPDMPSPHDSAAIIALNDGRVLVAGGVLGDLLSEIPVFSTSRYIHIFRCAAVRRLELRWIVWAQRAGHGSNCFVRERQYPLGFGGE